MKRITLLSVFLCLLGALSPSANTQEHVIYLPLIAGRGYNTSNFHLSDACDGPARTWFPAGTLCIAVIFDHHNLDATPVKLSLSKNETVIAAYWFVPSAPWGTGTFCEMLCDSLNSGTYTITCSIAEWLVGEQVFQVGQ